MVNDTTVIYRRSRQPTHTPLTRYRTTPRAMECVATMTEGRKMAFRFMTAIDDWRSAPSLCHTVLTTSRGRIPVTTGRCTYYRTDVK